MIKPTLKPTLKPLFLFIGLAILTVAGILVFKNFKTITPSASLLIETPNTTTQVFLDDQLLGQSPLQKDGLSAGEYTLKLISGEQTYQTKIELLGGTQTVVRRDFGPSDTFSSGEVLWFEKTGGSATVSITSDPDGALAKLDGKDIGETSVLVEDVPAGNHDLHLSFDNFETRKIGIRVESGYQLRISSKLALSPFPSNDFSQIDFGGEKVTIYNLSPSSTSLYVDAASLAKGIIYWTKTRGLGATKIKLNYFADSEGVLYDSEGKIFDPETFSDEPVETIVVGYLGNTDETALSDLARASVTALTKKVLKTPPLVDKVKILPTGVGWLRVRLEPSLSAGEITKINVGEKFELLAEQAGWVKIKLPDGSEGWVSSDFTEKFQEAP